MRSLVTVVCGILAAGLLAGGALAQPTGSWRHQSAVANIHDNWSWLDSARLNGHPEARVAVRCVQGGCQGRALGVWYDSGPGRWAVFYQDRSAMQIGDVYDVFDDAVAGVSAVGGEPVVADGPADGLVVTPNYNPGGIGGVYVAAQLAFAATQDGRVRVSPREGGLWPAGASFNIAHAQSGARVAMINPGPPPAMAIPVGPGLQRQADTLMAPPTPTSRDQRRLQARLGQSELPYGGARIYAVRPLFNPATEVCRGTGLFRVDNMALQCQSLRDAGERPGHVLVMPHPTGGVTLRLVQNRGPGQATQCATMARGVLVGSPAVDIRQCDLPPGARGWADVGGWDQVFGLRRVGDGDLFRIEIVDIDRGLLCWTPRDINRPGQVGVFSGEIEIVLEACSDSPDQRFSFQPTESVSRQVYAAEQAALADMIYFDNDPRVGTLQRSAVGRGIPGYAISGAVISRSTSDQNDEYSCAIECIHRLSCKAYTYHRGANVGLQGVCEVQSSIGQITPDNQSTSRILRPDTYVAGAISPF